jgi:hypothetical protein
MEQIDRASWMAKLNPNLRILDTYIPGSHDSSSYQEGVPNLVAEVGGAITQGGNYSDQLNVGIRYFDMRCQWHREYYVGPKYIYLHHSTINFDTLDNVLQSEIVPFANNNKSEVIILNIDVNTDDDDSYDSQAVEIMRLLMKYIDEDLIATAHLTTDKKFNTQVTWNELRGDKSVKKQFVIMWNYVKKSEGAIDSSLVKDWLANSDTICWVPYKDFNKHEVPWILSYLDDRVAEWKVNYADQMFVAQVINTPGISFAPGDEPRVKDYFYKDDLNGWVKKHGPGSNINIVIRDFVNKDYNLDALDYLINMNFVKQTPPLLLAPAQESQVDKANEQRPYTYYSNNNLEFDYCGGGRVILSSMPNGVGNVRCDDQVNITVSISNEFGGGGTMQYYKFDYSHGNSGMIYEEPPTDITNLFPRPGRYFIQILLTDLYPSDFGSSAFYLSCVFV